MLALWATVTDQDKLWLYWLLPGVFYVCQLGRAVLRQKLAALLLPKETASLIVVALMDVMFFWAWSILLLGLILSSAVGNTITWRNIKYRLNSPEDIEILK